MNKIQIKHLDEFFQKHFNLVFGGIKSITKVVEGCMKVRI
jgi:hypothetical protein